jgi:hypothetical protein
MITLNTPSKIANFNDVSILDQNVFRLDVSMDKSLFVHVVDAGADLNEEVESSILTQELFLSDEIEQITFGGIL